MTEIYVTHRSRHLSPATLTVAADQSAALDAFERDLALPPALRTLRLRASDGERDHLLQARGVVSLTRT